MIGRQPRDAFSRKRRQRAARGRLAAGLAAAWLGGAALACVGPFAPPPEPVAQVRRADGQKWLDAQRRGRKAAAEGQLVEASAAFREAIDALGPPDAKDARLRTSLDSLARVGEQLFATGRPQEAEQVAERVLDVTAQAYPGDTRALVSARHLLVRSVARQGRPEDRERADAMAAELIEALRSQEPGDPIVESELLLLRGGTADAQDRPADAEAFYREALALREKHFGEHALVALAENELAWFLAQRGRLDEADPRARRAVLILQQSMPGSLELASALDTLGEIVRLRGLHEESEKLHQQAVAIARRQRPRSDPLLPTLLDHLAQALRARGRADEAAKAESEARELRAALGSAGEPAPGATEAPEAAAPPGTPDE
jgi:tetratricopeptide (TPR) repeat protein